MYICAVVSNMETSMKKFAFFVAVLCFSAALAAGEEPGNVTYSLPRTNIVLNVTAEVEFFHAGPYARYAKKYLGIDAQTADSRTCRVSEVKISGVTEADPSMRYSILLPVEATGCLQLSSQGLISIGAGKTGENGWRFPAAKDNAASPYVMPANLETEAATLFSAGEGSVQQNAVVEKSPEKKARETAEMIFKIRENRYNILIGNTDATYSGEALKAAIDALSVLEKEYLALFLGKKEYATQNATFEVIPSASAKSQLYIAFRISDNEGLTTPDNVSGKPFYLELQEEKLAAPVAESKSAKPMAEIHYRVPVVCKAILRDGTKTWLQTRIPVYQLGPTLSYPVIKTK